MTGDDDEFADVADEAAELGVRPPLPMVVRRTVGGVSGVMWGREPEVLLLHGAGLNARTWDQTVLALGRPAIAIDLPGHGDSAWWDDFDYTPDRLAAAVAAYLDGVGVPRPLLVVGHSLGGMAAVALAASRPDLVSGIVLVDITPGFRAEDAAALFAFLSGPLVFGSRDEIVELALAAGIGGSRSRLARGVAHNTRIRDDGTVVFVHHLASPPPGRALDLDFSRQWEELAVLTVPVMLVRASHGFLPTSVRDEFVRRAPGARVVEIEAGHNVQEQQPVGLAAAIRDHAGPNRGPAVQDG